MVDVSPPLVAIFIELCIGALVLETHPATLFGEAGVIVVQDFLDDPAAGCDHGGVLEHVFPCFFHAVEGLLLVVG